MFTGIYRLRRFARLGILIGWVCWTVLGSAQVIFAQTDDPNRPEQPVKLIFIHHSSGENLLRDDYGGLGEALDKNNYFVSDTNYGWGPDSIGDRTDIVNWPEWFGSERREDILQALYTESGQNSGYSRTLADPGGENEIILFKSCFPNSNLSGSPDDPPTAGSYDYTVGSAKYIYTLLLDYFVTRPDKMFVVLTAPPVTDPTYAENARSFNTWLVNDWLRTYSGKNVFVFDFYNILTGTNNHHRFVNGQIEYIADQGGNTSAYASSEGDDHPNATGSQKATSEFVPLLNYYYQQWRSGQGETANTEPENNNPLSTSEALNQETNSPVVSEQTPLNFETDSSNWQADQDGSGSTIRCEMDTDQETASGDTRSLRIDYEMQPSGWGNCIWSFSSPQDWSGGNGIVFYVHSEQSGAAFTVRIDVGNEATYAPFESTVEVPEDAVGGWAQVDLPWSAFERATWAEMNEMVELDVSQIRDLQFGLWGGGQADKNSLWIDDIQLKNIESELAPTTELIPLETSQEIAPTSISAMTPSATPGGGFLRSLCPFSTAGLPLAIGGFFIIEFLLRRRHLP